MPDYPVARGCQVACVWGVLVPARHAHHNPTPPVGQGRGAPVTIIGGKEGEEAAVSWSLLLAGFSFLAPPDSSAQADRPEEPLAAKVRLLVRQLNDDQLARRESAERSLIDLGPEVLDLLPPIAPGMFTEVRQRLARIRTLLEKRAAESLWQPTRVWLEGELAVSDALAALARQTGNRVAGFEGRPGTVRANYRDRLYWEALDDVLDQAGLSVNPFGGQPNTLVVAARPPDELPLRGRAAYRGVLRFEAVRVELRRDLRNPAIDGMRLTVHVTWEPRISPISLIQPLANVEAVTDQGERLAASAEQAVLNASAESGVSAVELGIPLALPRREARSIARFRAVLTVLAPGRTDTFEFTNLDTARNVEQARAGVRVTLEELRKNLDVYEVRLRVRFADAPEALESHRGWVYRNEAFLLSAGGKRIDNAGVQPTRHNGEELGLSYLFELPGSLAGCKFVYKTPAVILRVPVDYEFRDIPLP